MLYSGDSGGMVPALHIGWSIGQCLRWSTQRRKALILALSLKDSQQLGSTVMIQSLTVGMCYSKATYLTRADGRAQNIPLASMPSIACFQQALPSAVPYMPRAHKVCPPMDEPTDETRTTMFRLAGRAPSGYCCTGGQAFTSQALGEHDSYVLIP